MRVGTWNLDGKRSPEHVEFLRWANADVWLLTEVHVDLAIPGMYEHRTAALMGPTKHFAAIFSKKPVAPEPDPHFATAMAWIGELRIMSSVLPWRSCGWPGGTFAERQLRALDALRPAVLETTVWGGDWNQAFDGRDWVGTLACRQEISGLIRAAGLDVRTASLPSKDGQGSVDHVAVPVAWTVTAVRHLSAVVGAKRLSDHDAYFVDVQL